MEPYGQRPLGGVGEGLRPIDNAQPLTQLHLCSLRSSRLRNPLPMGEGQLIGKIRFPLLHFGHHRFHLVGRADNFQLLIAFGLKQVGIASSGHQIA